MIRRDSRGFTALEILLVIIVVGLMVGSGWYVYRRQSSSASNNQVTNAPVQTQQETPDKTALTTDSEAVGWLEYVSAEKTYSMRLPDGWNFLRIFERENIYARGSDDVVYKKGIKAVVTDTHGGWDGASAFSVYVPEQNPEQMVRVGDKVGELITAEGKKAEKYFYEQTNEPDGIGYVNGSEVYNYYFDAAAKNIQIEYVVTPADTEQTTLVEKAIKTLKIN